jgi:sugar porter (SP) family MFS transporter
MNTKVWFWALTVSLGGFLFGFDTAVISGAEQEIQRIWGLSDSLIGLTTGMALLGTVFGALFGGYPAQQLGRKRSLFLVAVLYLLSAIGSALAPNVYVLMFARFIGGLGVGASSVVAPIYISEISPAKSRGRLVALFQFNIVLGILIAYFSNYWIGGGGDGAWRWMLGVETFPALLFTILILRVPNSPRWLILQRGEHDRAREILTLINPATVDYEMEAIERGEREAPQASLRTFLSGKYNLPILLAFLFAFFNQVSGINAVIYYAPRIFTSAGLEASSSLLATVGIGTANLIFTILGMLLIDRAGRRALMYICSFGYILSLSAVAYAFFSGHTTGYLVPVWLFLFVGAHAIGQGAVIWVFISEIFPNEVRSYGMSLGSGTHWVFAFIIASVFPALAGALGEGLIFSIFAGLMVFQLLFVIFLMPETKGVPLEELQEKLVR